MIRRRSERGELLQHPFTGGALAMERGLPDAVRHLIGKLAESWESKAKAE